MQALRNEILELKKQVFREEETVRHITIDHKNYTFKLHHNGKIYKASKTGIAFHSDKHLIKGIMGPIGSGKSTINCADVIFVAASLPPFKKDNIRRARFGFIRNTYPDLKETTLKAWMDWFGEFGEVPDDRDKQLKKSSPFSFRTIFSDGNGWIDLEVIFLALDKEKDVRKLDSLNFTGVFFNEARYIEKKFVERAVGRVRRYPDVGDLKYECDYLGGVTLDTNPPNYNHWWYQDFEEMRPDTYAYFRQPPGLLENPDGTYKTNPEADNLEHLDKYYYLNYAKTLKNKEEIKVMVLNQYGVSSEGAAVYTEYNHDIHSIDSINFIDDLPVHIGFDFGGTPAALIGQVSLRGRVLLIKEFVTEGGGLESMLENYLVPYINEHIPNRQIICWIDPSGLNAQDSDARNCSMTLKKHGFTDVRASISNKTETRLEAVRGLFRRLIDGKSAIVASREGCDRLVVGWAGKYKRRSLKTAYGIEYGEPEKNIYSHIQDACQYLCLGLGYASEKKNVTVRANRIIRRGG